MAIKHWHFRSFRFWDTWWWHWSKANECSGWTWFLLCEAWMCSINLIAIWSFLVYNWECSSCSDKNYKLTKKTAEFILCRPWTFITNLTEIKPVDFWETLNDKVWQGGIVTWCKVRGSPKQLIIIIIWGPQILQPAQIQRCVLDKHTWKTNQRPKWLSRGLTASDAQKIKWSSLTKWHVVVQWSCYS